MKAGVAGAVACGILVFAGLAFGASSFSDAAGDDNAAPDVTSVTVSESAEGMITFALVVGNYQTLPENSWFNLWFDTDSNQSTGDAGDEELVRFLADGTIEYYVWDGSQLVQRAAAGMAGQFAAGTLTVTVPKAELGGDSSFGVLAVSSRGQQVGPNEAVASDFAPDRGSSAYVGPASAAFPDPTDDGDAAPDITGVRVTDAKNGWVSIAISTPNYATLPEESVVFLEIDRDNRANTGDAGVELLITHVLGDSRLEVWDTRAREWKSDVAPTRVRSRNSGNVLTIDIHRSELGNAPRFGFAVAAADVTLPEGVPLAVDFAPDDARFFHYTMANKAALNLVAARLVASPAAPRAGKPFAVRLAVRRSDTNRGVTSGAVTCKVSVGGKPVKAKGAVVSGAARCSVLVPKTAAGSRLRGTIGIRVDGKSAASSFTYLVR